jgi:peroxiredoxin
MQNAYELLGIGVDATRTELDEAYALRRAAYNPTRVTHLGPEFVRQAEQGQAVVDAAYRQLRRALAAPPRLAPAAERRRDRETLLALLLFLAVGLLAYMLRGVGVPERTVAVEGADAATLTAKQAPDFELETLDGSRVRLSDYRGQVVMLNIWATWCPPCVRETPRLVRLANTYADDGLVVLGMNTTYQDDREKVAQFARDQQISYAILLDTTGEPGQQYRSRLMPSTYLIDRDGKIVYTRVGEIDEAALDEQIAALLRAE